MAKRPNEVHSIGTTDQQRSINGLKCTIYMSQNSPV
jgi:hypothetical protein